MRKLVLVAACCLMAGFAACGGEEEKIIDGTQNNAGTVTLQPEVKDEEKSDTAQTPEQKKNGYTFLYNGTEVVIDADASAYVDTFGDPSSYYETPSCAFDDLDKFYTYQGVEIDTYYSNGKDLVLGVVLLDDTVSTTEGICIGDSQDKVTTAYGEPTESTDNSATYQKDEMKLVFIFKEGVVASIEYKSLVLDAQ